MLLLYLFRYLKAQIMLKLQPDIEVPSDVPIRVRETLERIEQRKKMKEQWEEVWKKDCVEGRKLP